MPSFYTYYTQSYQILSICNIFSYVKIHKARDSPSGKINNNNLNMATFSQEIIIAVWNKGIIVQGVTSSLRRKDICGAWIDYNQYGNRNSDTGWEIDHIKPVSNGGSDSISNLRPLHWQNNARKSDGNLVCAVKAR